MGALTSYLIYRSGKKKGVRATKRATSIERDELRSVCTHCGHMAMQHSQDRYKHCPTYPSI